MGIVGGDGKDLKDQLGPLLTFPSDDIEPHKSDSQGHMVGDRQD